MDALLKYSDEADKCYGMAGMALSMAAVDCEDLIAALDIDADADEAVQFSQEFYFSGNPRYSAKLAWNQLLRNYQLTSAMLIANMMCRSYVGNHKRLAGDVVDGLRSMVRSEGHEQCSLEDDEIDRIFDKNYEYFDHMFVLSSVHRIVNNLVDDLRRRRRMTCGDLMEHLSQLRNL